MKERMIYMSNLRCPICGAEVINDICCRFPVCNYRMKVEEKEVEDMVVFDIETTGFSRQNDRVIEIGAIRVRDGHVVDKFSQLCNPGKDAYGNQIFISSRITEITGITNAMVENMPDEITVMKRFADWLGDEKVVAGQNIVKFDIPFLKAAAKRAGVKFGPSEAIDTLNIAKACKLHERGYTKDYKQPTLAEYFGFTYNAHRAVDDTEACYRILKGLYAEAKDFGVIILPDKV